MRSLNFVLAVCIVVSGCATSSSNSNPTAADAKKFMEEVNDTSFKLALEASQANWVADTYITDDTSALFARANQRLIDRTAQFAKEAVRFDGVNVAPDIRRQLNLLKVSLVMATPSNPKEGEELTKIAADLDATYGKGKWCEDPKKPEGCLDINQITDIMRD